MKWSFWVLIILAPIILILDISVILIFIFAVNKNSNLSMSSEQLCKLSDQRLTNVILDRIDNRLSRWNAEDYNTLNEVEITVYTAAWYSIEITNGGLCQYFVNPSKYTAPYLSDALLNIGALATEKDFTEFVNNNKIDL